MDELKSAWKNLEQGSAGDSISSDSIRHAIKDTSKGVMEKLRQNVKKKFYFCLGFTIIFGVLIPFINPLTSQILTLILFASYLIGDIMLWRAHKELQIEIDQEESIGVNMKLFSKKVKKVLFVEEMMGLSIYPVSVAAGFIFGGNLGAGGAEFMNQTGDWVALVIAMAILVPGGYFLARWMNEQAFGKYLKELDANIGSIQKIEALD